MRCGLHAQSDAGSPRTPARAEVHRRDEPKPGREERHGPPTRATETTPSSSGWRSDSSTVRGNSGSSSSSRTPRCARLASPGRGDGAAADDRRRRGAVVGSAKRWREDDRSPRVAAFPQRSGSASPRAPRRASAAAGCPGDAARASSCPVPGGPASRTLCSPAAASSRARRPRSWPRTSARSAANGSSRWSVPGGEARDVLLAAQVRDRLGEMTHGDGVDPRERRLGADSAAQRSRSAPPCALLRRRRSCRRRAARVRRGRARRRLPCSSSRAPAAAASRQAPRARSGGRIPSPPCGAPPVRG